MFYKTQTLPPAQVCVCAMKLHGTVRVDDLAIPQPIVRKMMSKSGFLHGKSDACFNIVLEHVIDDVSIPLNNF